MGLLTIICENQNLPRFVHLKKSYLKKVIKMKITFRQLYLPFLLRKGGNNRLNTFLANTSAQKFSCRSLCGLKLLPGLGSSRFKMNFTLDPPSLFSWMLCPFTYLLWCQMYEPLSRSAKATVSPSNVCNVTDRFSFNFLVFKHAS